MSIQLVMPQLGESVIEGTVTKWLVREGDVVAREQVIVSVATDKADSDVPAPQAGRIVKFLAAEGDTVKVGAPLCEIADIDAAAAAAPPKPPVSATMPSPSSAAVAAQAPSPSGPSAPAMSSSVAAFPAAPVAAPTALVRGLTNDNGTAKGPTSPVVRKLALEHDVDLETVQGSGARGRVTKDDVLRVAESREVSQPSPPREQRTTAAIELASLLNSGAKVPIPNVGYGAYKVPAYRPHAGDEVIPFSRRRRLTADHMVYSKLTAPHVVTVAEVDLFRTTKLREANKDRYKKDGSPLTMLTFVCAAAVRALREFPGLNARVLDDAYVLLKDINLGVAVDAPDGLVVPNVKRADELSLRGLARAIDDVASRARVGKITADDLAGCSFSISNPGLKGNLFGGAIIAQPNAGILRMGEIQKRVVVVEADGQDVMVIHPVMFVALSYDHRIIDGVLANSFLWRVTELLEKGDFAV